MTPRYGLFDVDCLEMNEQGDGLTFRPRVVPIIPLLGQLYHFGEAHNAPFVFCTCCSGSMPQPGVFEDVLHIPLDKSKQNWCAQVPDFRRFYLEKITYGDPKENAACRAFDVLGTNANGQKLFSLLKVDTWIVFGNGFDYCVGSAVKAMLAAGHKVILPQDVRISSAGGTPQSEEQTLAEMRAAGATITTLADILAGIEA